MKKVYIIVLWTILSCIIVNMHAVTPKSSTLEDWTNFLKKNGYYLYSFDISEFSDTTRTIILKVREYENDSLVRDDILPPFGFNTRLMLDEIPEDARNDMKDMENPDKGIVRTLKQTNIGLTYHAQDSIAIVTYDMVGHGILSPQLSLRPIATQVGDKKQYLYAARPFAATDSISTDKFVPLVLLSSFWIDNNGIIRSCGEHEIKSLDSDIIKNSPHSYIIGFDVDTRK